VKESCFWLLQVLQFAEKQISRNIEQVKHKVPIVYILEWKTCRLFTLAICLPTLIKKFCSLVNAQHFRTHTPLERNQTKLLILHKDKLASEKQAFPNPLLYDYNHLT